MIPAEQALRSLLALKLFGSRRQRHVMADVFDEGLALPLRGILEGEDGTPAAETDLRLPAHFLCQPPPAEPATHRVRDSAPPVAQATAADLRRPALGLEMEAH
jgi:hypothetical protein